MKMYLQFLFFLLFTGFSCAQKNSSESSHSKYEEPKVLSASIINDNPMPASCNENDSTFTLVDNMPKYPGGELKMMEFIDNHLIYPEKAEKAEIEGRVFICVVVEKDGSLTNIKVLRGFGYGCEEEAVRVVEMMPKWKPGKQRGKEVRVAYIIPVRFTLP